MDESVFTAFDQVERTHWWFTARREIVLAVAAGYVAPGSAILDVGCGTGYFLEKARERYDVWGVDPSATAVELCRRRGLDQVLEGSAYDLDALGERRFDAIFFLDVVEHLDDDLLALTAARRRLRPGGVVIVTVPAFMFLWSGHDVANHHRRRYRRPGLDTLLRRASFAVERLSYFNFYLFPLAAADRLASRLTRRPAAHRLRLPAPWMNSLMRRVFESEKASLGDPRSGREFPFGLSLLAVGRHQGTAA